MSYKQPTTFRETNDLLVPLQSLLYDAYKNSGYSDKDARGVVFLNCSTDISVIIMFMNTFVNLQEKSFPPPVFEKLFGQHTGEMQNAVNFANSFLRLGLVLMFVFRVENMMANILSKLDPSVSHRAYSKIVNRLFDKISISDKDRKKDILHVLAHMRNAIHSNGIHNNESIAIPIGNYTFTFEKGKIVTCLDWGAIPLAIQEIVKILQEIIQTQEVKAITALIENKYVEPD